MKLVSLAFAGAVLLAVPFPARGAAPSVPPEPPSASAQVAAAAPAPPPMIILGLKAGGIFPQVLSPLSSTYTLALEVGWLLPILNRQLALVVEGAYSAPTRSLSVDDPRLPSGSYQYSVTEQTFGIYAGPKYFFLPLRGTFIPWVSVGIRASSLRASWRASLISHSEHTRSRGLTWPSAARQASGTTSGPASSALNCR